MGATKEPDSRIYVDSSAMAKLYLPEPESEALDGFMRGRRNLLISDLVITEVISAVARRRREGLLTPEQSNAIRNAIRSDGASGEFHVMDLSPSVHREAERLLLLAPPAHLRTLDALHLALALSSAAAHIVTFDVRMQQAAVLHGLNVLQLG